MAVLQPDCNHFELLGLFADDLHISFTERRVVPDADVSLSGDNRSHSCSTAFSVLADSSGIPMEECSDGLSSTSIHPLADV